VNTPAPRPPRFEDRLLTAILDDFDHLTEPSARPRRVRSRRRAGVTALIAGATAAGVAVAVAALGQPAARPAPVAGAAAGRQHQHQQPAVLTAAYVVARLRSALNANTAVVATIDHAPNSQTGKPEIDEIWTSTLSPTYRIVDLSHAGRPVTGYLVTVRAHRTVSIVINYRARTWTRTVYPFGSAESARRPGPKPVTATGAAAQLRAEVRAGKVTLDGRATVDGQRAIHLTEHLSGGGVINLWVSPASYLPIREVDGAAGTIRDDYRWLPASRANLRLLTPAGAIPAGFSHR
jgi:hypothetical protein